MTGLVASRTKMAIVRLGGTGVPYSTPRSRDIVYASPWENDAEDSDGIPQVSPHTALTYIPFFAGVRLISEDIGALPLGLFREVGDGRQPYREHPLHPLLHDAPNEYMTASTFRTTLHGHVLTWGNGYAEIEYADDGSIFALWPLRPDRMAVLMDEETGRIFYRYRWPDGRLTDFPWRKIFHVHGMGFDGFVGYSVVAMARRAISMAVAGERFASGYMKKGNVPPAVLKAARSYTDPALENIRRSWDEIDHRNRVAILEEGLDLQVVGLPPKDVQFIESADYLRGLMATLLRLPPHKLSDVSRSTSWGTGIETQDIGYLKHTLNIGLVTWEQEIKLRFLREEPDAYAKHNVDALLRADTAARWTAYEKGLYNGVWTINDILRFEDRNPISADEGGDIRRAPLNMVPLDQWRDATLRDRVEMARALVLAGYTPEGATETAGLPDTPHTGLEPVSLTDQLEPTAPGTNGDGPG